MGVVGSVLNYRYGGKVDIDCKNPSQSCSMTAYGPKRTLAKVNFDTILLLSLQEK